MTIKEVLACATTFLFVPGNRPERFAKAHAAGADVVIIDLEDAVAVDEKAMAREHVLAWLQENPSAPTLVRVNPGNTQDFIEDLQALKGAVRAVMLPKTEHAQDVAAVCERAGGEVAVVALIETALGVLNALAIARSDQVVRLAFGNVDFAAQLQIDAQDRVALLFARSQLVLASAAAGLTGPVDGVTTVIDQPQVTTEAAQYARTLGFYAKLCIHPKQVLPVREAYQYSEAEREWARSIVALSASGNVACVNGEMIDRPVILRARQILAVN